ncbi:MAG: hypothetical protein NZ455_00375 [Bacteroidia bacterium]|nr:hypothetical protein [Bacteroidia bacterium]
MHSFSDFCKVKIYFNLVCHLFSSTYKIKFCISGISLHAACVRHAEGVR